MSLSPGEVVLWDLFKRVSLKEQLACMVRNPVYFTAIADFGEKKADDEITVREACYVTERSLVDVATAMDELALDDEHFVISLDRFSVMSVQELRELKKLVEDIS